MAHNLFPPRSDPNLRLRGSLFDCKTWSLALKTKLDSTFKRKSRFTDLQLLPPYSWFAA